MYITSNMNKKKDQIVLAGGCFWCTEAIFQRINGVDSVVSGYTGGKIRNPSYREICTGRTGHAEAIMVNFDPEEITIQTLLEVFFATHDPTTLNRQGNDVGTQYRSAVFYRDENQRKITVDFIRSLDESGVFDSRIVTEVEPLKEFFSAEPEHQNYFNENKDQPYCMFIIDPKIRKINKYYSDNLKIN